MQSDDKQIYEITSKRTGKPTQLYKDVGTVVFSSLYEKLRKPKTLILKLKGVGSWYLRKKRMETLLSYYPVDYDKMPLDSVELMSPHSILRHENKKEMYSMFKERLAEYEKYIALRNEIRQERFKTQTIIKNADNQQ
jgi:hypothetical protein